LTSDARLHAADSEALCRLSRRTKLSRMANKRQLTGGTGDVNPQYLSGRVTLSAANTVTTLTLGTPIVRVGPQSNNRATIMEILKVFVEMPIVDLDAAAATNRNAFLVFSTTSFGTTLAGLSEPRVFCAFQKAVRNAFTAAGTGTLDVSVDPITWDMTDGAGHGVLVATDNIFIQATTNNYTAAQQFDFKILYRFKTVDLAEYIGIVQSQQ